MNDLKVGDKVFYSVNQMSPEPVEYLVLAVTKKHAIIGFDNEYAMMNTEFVLTPQSIYGRSLAEFFHCLRKHVDLSLRQMANQALGTKTFLKNIDNVLNELTKQVVPADET